MSHAGRLNSPAALRPRRLVKLGGSLLGRKTLTSDLRLWLSENADADNLILTGGGRAVEALRRVALLLNISDVVCHWSAIRLMDDNAIRAQASLPATSLVDVSPSQLVPNLPQLDHAFLQCLQWCRRWSTLPTSWSVSSDALAAEMCLTWQCEELVLLKSTLPKSTDPADWAAEGFVDAAFPNLVDRLPGLRIVDLSRNRSLLWRQSPVTIGSGDDVTPKRAR